MSSNGTINPQVRWPRWAGYLTTLLAVAVVTVILDSTESVFPLGRFPIPYVLLVMASAYLFGEGPAVLASVLGLTAYIYYFIPPEDSFKMPSGVLGWAGITGFFLGMLVVAFAMLLIRRSRRRVQLLLDKLSQSNRQVTDILESITDAFFALDREWRFSYVNQEAERLLQHGREQLMGCGVWDVFPEAVGTMFSDEYHRAMSEHVPVAFEAFYPPFDVWFEVRAYPTAEGLSVYFHDITERKQAEEALWESERQFRTVFDSAGDAIFVHDMEGRFLEVNRTAAERLGYTRDELLHMTVPDIDTPECAALRPQRAEELRCKGHVIVETSHVRRDGTIIPTELSSRLIEYGGIPAVISTARDITKRKEAEEGLIEARNEAESLRMEAQIRENEAESLRTEAERAAEGEAEARAIVQSQLVLLQRALLPEKPCIGGGYSIAAVYLPGMEGAEIGGDFYDVFETEDGKTAVIIGDVTGKGIPAAALAASARSTIRAFVYDTSSPGEALTHTNAVLYTHEATPEAFVTADMAVLDLASGVMCYASAAHPPAAIYRARTREVDFLDLGQPPLGVVVGQRFDEYACSIEPGDKIVFYTDGISEARRGAEMFGSEGIEHTLKTLGDLPPDDILRGLLSAARDWSRGHFTDDVAVIVIERPSGTLD